jgi:hypothetical protein
MTTATAQVRGVTNRHLRGVPGTSLSPDASASTVVADGRSMSWFMCFASILKWSRLSRVVYSGARPSRRRANRGNQGWERGARVPRRPGGGESPHGSIEAGLRDLVRDKGPDLRQLSRGDTESLRGIMLSAPTPTDWMDDTKAAAILSVIQELVQDIPNPRWKASAMAAFRLPAAQYMSPDHESLAGRWRTLARKEDASSDLEIKKRTEAYRGYWMAAANYLADKVEQRFEELRANPAGWEAYRIGLPPAPPHSLPISFDRTDVLYRFHGRLGIQSISYRWLIAHAPVDHYEPVGWYYNEPDAPVEIIPLANCSIEGPLRDLPQGGKTASLKFSHELSQGEDYFFSYMIQFNSQQPCRPLILYEVRGLEMRTLIIRVQFDPTEMPRRCWYFDVEAQNEGWETPQDGAPELLTIAPNGYVELAFENCRRGRKFGLRWQWDDQLSHRRRAMLAKERRDNLMGGDG